MLVANETAKERIPEELHLALVLTIYEAKGLEFDDVLLYNFFTDSEVFHSHQFSAHPDLQAKIQHVFDSRFWHDRLQPVSVNHLPFSPSWQAAAWPNVGHTPTGGLLVVVLGFAEESSALGLNFEPCPW